MTSAEKWKEAARWYRARFRSAMQGIDHRTRLAAAEHDKRVALVNAMSELVPQIAIERTVLMHGIVSEWCRACESCVIEGHKEDCLYIAALTAIYEHGKSVDVQ